MPDGHKWRQRKDPRHDQDLRNPRQEELQEGVAGTAGGRRGEMMLKGLNVSNNSWAVCDAVYKQIKCHRHSMFVSIEQLHREPEEEQCQTQTCVSHPEEEIQDHWGGKIQISNFFWSFHQNCKFFSLCLFAVYVFASVCWRVFILFNACGRWPGAWQRWTTASRETACWRTDPPPTWRNFTSSSATASYGPPSGDQQTNICSFSVLTSFNVITKSWLIHGTTAFSVTPIINPLKIYAFVSLKPC